MSKLIQNRKSNIALLDSELCKIHNNCRLCPRNCGAKRTKSIGNGFCGAGSEIVIARAAAHFGEEPCISGTNGSGAVFFSGCTMRCIYCQNHEISKKPAGKHLSIVQFSDILKKLEDSGVHNINMVTPTHFTPMILEAVILSAVKIPIIWNTSGYETKECIEMTKGIVSVYLPDFKYFFSRTSKYCSEAPNYFKITLEAIKTMYKIAGTPMFDEKGLIKKGLLIRHLVLPGLSSESIKILETITSHFPDIPVSLMSQYVPIPNMPSPLNRKVNTLEYEKVLTRMQALNIKGYTQEFSSASKDYIPEFLNPASYI